MGAAISAIERWISAGFGLPAAWKSLWERVASLFRAAFDFFKDLVGSVRAYISYERREERSTENERGRSRFYVDLGVNADQDQRQSVNERTSQEELLRRINQGRSCYDELENIVRAHPTHENLQEAEARLDRLVNQAQEFLGDAINTGLN